MFFKSYNDYVNAKETNYNVVSETPKEEKLNKEQKGPRSKGKRKLSDFSLEYRGNKDSVCRPKNIHNQNSHIVMTEAFWEESQITKQYQKYCLVSCWCFVFLLIVFTIFFLMSFWKI